MGDFIIWKKNDTPAYQLTSLIDDYHFGVNIICRGHDLVNSTSAQLFLNNELGLNDLDTTSFFFHSLLKDVHNQKLSKSGGAGSLQDLRIKGQSAKNIYLLLSTLIGLEACESKEDFFRVLKTNQFKALLF